MITRTAARRPTWQREVADAVSSTSELLALLGLEAEAVDACLAAQNDFPLRVPQAFVRRMQRGDPRDPLLLQVLATGAELESVPGFSRDPLAEEPVSPTPGLLHKYQGRVLLVVTGACAVHCRYCFRRHFPYAEHQPWNEGWQKALDYIATESSIHEVILSGGDPLSVHDEKLARLIQSIEALPHVQRLRIHTRLPIVVPSRIDDGLLDWLTATRLDTIMVVHANHAREIDGEVTQGLRRLRDAGVALLNQAVLLRGINDTVASLQGLNETLFSAGVLPYYLNLLDPVAGAAHFEVGEKQARELIGELMRQTSGYLVPRLVREVPGAAAKVPVDLRFI